MLTVRSDFFTRWENHVRTRIIFGPVLHHSSKSIEICNLKLLTFVYRLDEADTAEQEGQGGRAAGTRRLDSK